MHKILCDLVTPLNLAMKKPLLYFCDDRWTTAAGLCTILERVLEENGNDLAVL